jgi:hypothetical protein
MEDEPMNVVPGVAFSCERCKSGRGVRREVRLHGGPGQLARDIAFTLTCLDCGYVAAEHEWLQRNLPRKQAAP